MSRRNIFLVFCQLIGISFGSQKLFFTFTVLVFNLTFAGFAVGYFLNYNLKLKEFSIYNAIDMLQNDFFVAIHLSILMKALHQRNLQKDILDKINSRALSFNEDILYFSSVIVVPTVIRTAKLLSSRRRSYHLVATVSEIVVSSSVLLSSYLMSLLVKDLIEVKHSLQMRLYSIESVRDAMLLHFRIKRKLQERFSIELFLIMTHCILQLVIGLYFICMRLMFNHLKEIKGKIINLHVSITHRIFSDFISLAYLVQPVACLYMASTAYQSYHDEVSPCVTILNLFYV